MAKGKVLSKVTEDLHKFGWHVTKVLGDENYPPFAYTVGLSVTYDHPEVVIFGLNDDLDLMHHVLDSIEKRVAKGERFEHGDKKRGILPGYTCPFARFPKSAYADHLGQAVHHLGGEKAFSAVQCIWPDPKKRLPWDPKVMPPILARQPVFCRPDAGPRDAKWPFPESHSRRALTTIQVVRGKEPVRYVGRFRDGDYQFVCETTDDEKDLVWTTLGWLYDHDPGLKAVASIARGEARMRDSAVGRWKKVAIPEDLDLE
jgi:hypothetical protein